MEHWGNFVNIFLEVPSEVWVLILGAAGVSVFTQVLKKILAVENEKVIMTLFMAASFAASGLEYLLSQTNLPPTVLGINTALIIGIATPLYRFAIKPASRLLSDFKAYRNQVSSKLNELETLNAAAALPEAKVVGKGEDAEVIAPLDGAVETPAQPKVADF